VAAAEPMTVAVAANWTTLNEFDSQLLASFFGAAEAVEIFV